VAYNVEGYWDGLLQWVRKAVSSGFISESNEGIMVEAKDANEVIACLRGYRNSEGRFKLHWGEK
jgi:predicted Rossmann-fold nucleotide-binding protein